MNTLTGRIVHAQTGNGLKDLTVLLYDIDFALASSLDFEQFPPGDNPLRVPPYLEDILPSGEEQHPMLRFASQILYLLYAGRDEGEDSTWGFTAPAGARLGSTLSGGNGGFTIQFDDVAFQNGDQEIRPEALLMVLAPDQSLSTTLNDGSPPTFVGTPEYQRILHISFFPLRNMARSEAQIIKIAPELLARFGLAGTESSTPDPQQISILFSNAQQERTSLNDALRNHTRQLVQQQQGRQQQINNLVSQLSATPKAFRQGTGNYFISPKETNPLRLRNLVQTSRRDGINQVAQQTLISGSRQPQAFLSLDEDILRRILPDQDPLGLLDALANGESLELEVDFPALCTVLYEKNGGAELTRRPPSANRRAIRDQVITRLRALRDPDSVGGNPTPPGEDTSPPVLSDLSPEEQVKAIVLEQVRKLSADTPDDLPSESAGEQRRRISASLQELAPPVSPADTTAYHDFTSLQMAFPSVWTEAFDGQVEDIVSKLGIEYLDAYQVFREGEGDEDILNRLQDFDPSELYDLNEYTELLGALTGDISAMEQTPTPDIVRRLLIQTINASLSTGRSARAFSEEEFKWNKLSIEQQAELVSLASEYHLIPEDTPPADSRRSDILNFVDKEFLVDMEADKVEPMAKFYQTYTNLADSPAPTSLNNTSRRLEIQTRALEIINDPQGRSTRAQRLMAELADRLKAEHSFRIFAENTYNFGILTTHRQKWVPGDYQTGSLVSTITLAPGEKRQYTKKETLKRSRNRKEEEKNASTISDERTFSNKVSEDIMDKMSTNTNFAQKIEGSVTGQLGVFKIESKTATDFKRDQAVESQRQRQALHEATRKAAQEYKNERSLSISTETSSEFETSYTSEISNPNNEITVTYLFYELERQYRVTEHLHKVQPVVMVAQYVPRPDEIDEDWLLAHEWVVRRVLLDRSFHPALDFVADGLVSDEVALEVIREQYETQKALVEELADSVSSLSELQTTLRDTLIQTSTREKMAHTYAKRAKKKRRRSIARRFFDPLNISMSGRLAAGDSSLTFGQLEDPALLEARREALETRLEYLDGNLEDAQLRLNNANTAFAQVSEELAEAMKESFTRRNLVTQLKVHIKDNILYYMQAIWTHEYSQQRFMRLYNLPIEIPMPGPPPPRGSNPTTTVTVNPLPEAITEGLYRTADFAVNFGSFVGATIHWPTNDGGAPVYHMVNKRLHQVADVDQLIGFKGNYMIFPMKSCTFITDYMMQDYVDEYMGVRSPDPLSEMSTDELLQYAEQIWHHEDTNDTQRDALEQLIVERLRSPRTDDELIVVPTGQLFIEALKGNHALLEDFKLKHRQMDVQKVQEEVRAAQLENLRKALRLVRDEGELLDDPDIDEYIVNQDNTSSDE